MVDDLHERLRARGWDNVRPRSDSCCSPPAIKRSPGPNRGVDGDQQTGNVEADHLDGPRPATSSPPHTTNDGRARPVRITDKGASLLDVVEEVYAEIESEWATVIGVAEVDVLRRDLTTVLTQRHRGQLPPIRPTG